MICLLSGSTPAAPQTIVAVAKQTSISLMFWYYASGFRQLIHDQGFRANGRQESQKDRDASVSRIEISPGDVTIDLSDRVTFSAVAFDANANTIGGVKIKWRAQSTDSKRKVRLSQRGELEATTPGSFTVSATAGSASATVNVTVRPSKRKDLNEIPVGTRQVSTRDLPAAVGVNQHKKSSPANSAHPGQSSRRDIAMHRKSHATKTSTRHPEALPFLPIDGWNDTNYWSADDPGNGVGNPPGGAADGGAGSGNFQFAAPIYSVQGRGINIALGLAYNSRLWSKAGTQISYDNDHGWPAPGFNLGFGKLLGIGVYTGCMLVDADGTRHGYTGSISIYSWGTYGVMHTTDGSFIDYTYWTGTNGVITWAQARLPNGTIVNYGAYSQAGGGVFPTSIEDANGNVITITYVNNSGPRIQTITDTLGRNINFSYDYNNLLTAITTPGYNNGAAQQAVRLHYHQLNLAQYSNYGFNSSVTAGARDSYPWVLDAIYYPANNTGYWLNDSDSYSSYGMLAKVIEERGMGFSASSLNDMGTVSQGSITRKETYAYPLTPNYNLTDAPTYGSMTESWSRDGNNLDSATTFYDVRENDNPRTVTITLPNSTKSKQYSFNAPGQYNDGLVYHDVTFLTDENSPLQSGNALWEQGAYSSARSTRVEKIDERGQLTATAFSYGSVYNQVTEVRNYDYGGSILLRSARTTYQNSPNYTNNHIFSLPLTVEVFGPTNTRVSRTEYQYDGQALTDTPGVVMHDETHNPYAEPYEVCDCYQWDEYQINCVQWNCYWTSAYNSATDYRGNVTQITTYSDAANLAGAISETRRYDIVGNNVTESTSCCQQTSCNYTVDTQYAYPVSKTRGSPTDSQAQVTTSAVYDFNTGLGRITTDANGRPSTTIYDPNTLRPTSTISATGAHVDYTYDDTAMTVTMTTYLAAADGGGIANQNVKYLNGLAQVRQEKALGAGGVWDVVDTTYDSLGQLSQQTRPYRTGETPQWTSVTYDALGRRKTVTAPDGSMTQTFYNETARPDVASNLPGETTRVQDAWGRERWGRIDASGRMVEVVEPIFWGTGSTTNGMLTTYTFNTLGDLLMINSMSGTQVLQTRSFRYDSLGRLTAQKLAEINATLNDSGVYVGNGTWSDVFTYDERSNLTSRTDARGVKTVYTYNDPLNRLQSVSWDTSGFGDTGNPILQAATVTYQYRNRAANNPCDPLDSSGRKDVTQIATVTTAGVSTQGICYDTEGRASSKTLTLTSRLTYPFATDYIYDSLNRVSKVLYPAEYGNGGSQRKLAQQTYDVASRLSGLTFDGQTQATNIVYNAASQATSLSVGTGTNQVNETYGYNAQTGLLESQTVTRGGATLLNLSYDYTNAAGKRTGQLTKIYNNLDHANKDRSFEYDALGRLVRATGGQGSNVIWAQRYEYDRYGNRNNVYSFGLEDYVRNFYQGALNRQPNSTELSSALSSLRSAYAQGQSQFLTAMQNLGQSLFTSTEYINRSRTDSQFVTDLYHAFLYREPDSEGLAYWVSVTQPNGRPNIILAFEWAPEFYTKVAGISPYAPPAGVSIPRDGLQGMAYSQTTNRVVNDGWYYDAAGNQTRALVPDSTSTFQRYQYDAANRLVNVKNDNNTTVVANYTYGDSNERLIATEGTTRTYYLGEGGITFAEYNENGSSTSPLWSKSYVYLGERMLSILTPNGSGGEAVEYQHPDRLGTRIVTNPVSGSWSEQATLPFGTALDAESSGTPTKRRFTSYERSGTSKLDYAVNRHYDPQQGRFTQADPIGMSAATAANPQSLNLYAYCGNDPVNRVDPSGLFWGKLFGFFKKVLKIFEVVLAVVCAVLAVTIAPEFGPGAVIGFLALSGLLFADALGPKWVHQAIALAGGATAIYLQRPEIIWNFRASYPGSRPVRWFSGIGALASFLASAFNQQKTEEHGETVYTEVHDKRGGSRLSPCARDILGKMGFGKFVDLDEIRVHIGIPDWVTSSAETFGGITPKAITVGNDIYWRSVADYNPSTVAGLAEVGHELTHTMQYNVLGASMYFKYFGQWVKNRFAYGEGMKLEKSAMEVERLLNLSIPQRFGNDPCKKFRH